MDAQTVLLITTIIGVGYQIYMAKVADRRAARDREWDLEDRRLAREERERKENELAEKVEKQAQTLARGQHAITAQLAAKIDENTQISVNAFNEANDVNKKIAKLQERFIAVAAPAIAQTLDRVDDNTQEAVERLRKIDDDAAP